MLIDDAFGIHARALVLRGQRARLLATNLANADTPNFKARDIPFDDMLRNESTKSVPVAMTSPAHIAGVRNGPFAETDLLYRTPMQPSLDGNTVDTQIEQAQFAENELRYESSLRILNGRISSLLLAIKGE